jgi:manganese/zinc/iron transport system permease protein
MTGFLPTALQSAVFAALLLGLVCGLLGTFVVVRRMALTGDMISHAVLPGVVIGLAWNASRNPLIVLGCAVVAGVIGSAVMHLLLRKTKLKPDVALALVLSVFFALGISLISRLQPAGVQAFLYGQIAAIDQRDLMLLTVVTALTLILIPLGFRALRLVSFDPAFARVLGFPVKSIEVIFFALLTVVIVIAMQAVGVILVTAMLVTPAAAARFCTKSLPKTALIACGFGAFGGWIGVLISASRTALPTGPLMALSVTGLFLGAALFGPRGGWFPVAIRRRRQRLRILGEDILKHLWHHEENRGIDQPVAETLVQKSQTDPIQPALSDLEKTGKIVREHSEIRLTQTGRVLATQLIRAHRLWERYLTEQADFKPDHVHDDAERTEHWIDSESRAQLEKKLGNPTLDPHGRPIPPSHRKGAME